MKYQTILITLLFLAFISVNSSFSQSTKLKDASSKNIVITMKQESSRGWGGGVRSAYTVTLTDNGAVTFDGMDEGNAISKYEPPTKVLRHYQIPKNQFNELVSEFYKIDFFSLKNEYQTRDNGNGTFTIIDDGGLATVITSITVSGKTKTVMNINFAPERLIELQRKIYAVSNVSSFVKFPPYWLSKLPDELFPPRNRGEIFRDTNTPVQKIVYRKIQRSSPKGRKEKHIDLAKRWGFITPCVNNKVDVEKLLGKPITTDESLATYNTKYNLKNEKISVFYSNERTNIAVCNDKAKIDTVILFSVIPIKDIKLSELNIDLTKFKKNDGFQGREQSYRNQEEGIFIETEVVEFSDKKQVEMITSIEFDKNFKGKKYSK